MTAEERFLMTKRYNLAGMSYYDLRPILRPGIQQRWQENSVGKSPVGFLIQPGFLFEAGFKMQAMKMLIITWLITTIARWIEKKLVKKIEKGGSHVQKSV